MPGANHAYIRSPCRIRVLPARRHAQCGCAWLRFAMTTKSRKNPPPWEKKNPVKPASRTKLTAAQKHEAKARADAAGRRYPNLVDNMAVAKKANEAKRKKRADS